MLQICLASAPTITEFTDLSGVWDEYTRRVPLSPLVLAAELEAGGWRPSVVDLDSLYAAWIGCGCDRTRFAEHAAGKLAERDADVYGFGSICNSYPLTLRVASALRRLRPSCRIVLGGPQATATDVETLAAFPAVDLVVRGEGDASLPELIRTIEAGGDPSLVRGVTHRQRGEVVRTPDAPRIEDLDSLPRAAYHLCPPPGRGLGLPLEAGRGCPFGCSFCSTSRFFGRRFRMRSPGRIVEDMLFLHRAYGVRRFELVHDNFTVDRRRVVAFCEAIAAARVRLSWTCSSRTDSVDEDLLRTMRRAGCDGIFFGVESGSPVVQEAIGKRIDPDEARQRLRLAARRRIPSAVGFVAGFAEETLQDVRLTADLFVDLLRSDLLEPQLSILSPLPGTPVQQRHRNELILDDISSDITFQGERQDPADHELIARHPDVFPSFYAVPAPGLDRRELHELRCFLISSRHGLRWLVVSASRIAGGAVELFHAFRAWRPVDASGWSFAALNEYYGGTAFRDHLVRFVRDELAPGAGAAGPALSALADLCASLPHRAPAQGGRRPTAAAAGARPGAPALAPGVILSRIGCDASALVRCARQGGELARVPRRESVLVVRSRRRRLEVLRLSEVAASLLSLCDGRRGWKAIARAFARRHPAVAGVAGERVCALGLEALVRKGLVVT